MQRSTAFLDLLFNLLLGFTFLFFMSFIMIKPQVKSADARNKAEYVISVTWPDNNRDDIDTWLEDPLGGIVWFKAKEKNFSHLDRDDLGMLHDVIVLADGSVIECPRNQELVTLRGFIPGEWVLNLHAYHRRENSPTHVRVSIDKVNPSFSTVFFKDVVMSEQWQETTVTRFNMTAQGAILGFDSTPKELVQSAMPYNYQGPETEGGIH